MASSTSTKLLSNCLKSLQKPVVWLPLGIFILLCLALWQYYRQTTPAANPFATEPSATNSSALTKTDTVELLLEGSKAGSTGVGSTRANGSQGTNPAMLGEGDPELPSDLRLTRPTDQPNAQSPNAQSLDQDSGSIENPSVDDPFASYRAEYQFSADSNAATETANTPLPSEQSRSIAPSSVNFDSRTSGSATAATSSALFEALSRQDAARETQARESQARESQARGSQIGEQTYRPPTVPNPPDATAPDQFNTSSNSFSNSPYAPVVSEIPVPPFPTTPTPSTAPIAPSVLYTPPTFSQPDQGRPVNPRQ